MNRPITLKNKSQCDISQSIQQWVEDEKEAKLHKNKNGEIRSSKAYSTAKKYRTKG